MGCDVPLTAPPGQGPVNTCQTTSDCAQGAACTQGICVATSFDLTGLLLEVRPRADATFGAGMSFLIDPSTQVPLEAQGGQPFNYKFPVTLPNLVSIQGGEVRLVSIQGGEVRLALGTALDKGCSALIPAQLTFYRVPQFRGIGLAGLPNNPVRVTTSTTAPYKFNLDIVSGNGVLYDVYIEPLPVPGCSMVVPPVYLPAQNIDENTTFTLPPIGTLEGVIYGLMNTSMWQVDVVEPDRGLPISAGTKLAHQLGASGATVTAQTSPAQGNKAAILRLTPLDPRQPDPKSIDTTRPTVFFSLPQGKVGFGMVAFAIGDLAANTVEVGGNVTGGPHGVHRVAAQLTIQSVTLSDGTISEDVAYSVPAVSTDTTGAFDVRLPPGIYTVRATPLADNGFSITDNDSALTVPAGTSDCTCAVPLHVDAKPTLAGTITTPTGQPLSTTTVGVNPSQMQTRRYLDDITKLASIAARVESTSTDGSGIFSLLVDVAVLDLVVQPDPSTNFPWLVAPGISAPLCPTSLTSSPLLCPMPVTSPAILGGTVSDQNGNSVADAEIDAWLPVRDPKNPGTVVKIATTSTDANGTYRLVLPSSLSSF
jgi:hypothetical protein